MANLANFPELSSILRLGLDENYSSNQPSSCYSSPSTAVVTGTPCYFQHSGLNLDNQDLHPQSRLANSAQEFLQAIGLPDPYYSVERGRSEHYRCLAREPCIGSLEDGPDYKPRMSSRTLYHPYIRVLKNPHRKRLPAVKYEPDASKLQQRCSREGGDPDAIRLISKAFAEGVNLSALTRQKTAEEVACQVFGEGPGQVYLGFLETIQMRQGGGEDREFRYRCRLCPDFATAASWKHERDVLRHLRKHHFGLANECKQCGKWVYTTGEMRSHRCVLTK